MVDRACWLAAIAVQVIVPMGAAPGYDLTKWAAVNYLPGSAGYFKVARQQAVARSLEVPGGVSRSGFAARTRCTSARIRRA